MKELQSAGKGGGLAGIEIIAGVVMADEEWNAANVLRPRIQCQYANANAPAGLDHSSAEDQPQGHFGEV